MNITGLDTAVHIPVGATLTAATWHVAEHYGPGPAHATEREALVAGITAKREQIERLREFHGPSVLFSESFSIDLRWTMKWDAPRGGASGNEATVRRITYDSLADAEAHLARIDKYTPEGSRA